MFIPSLRQSKLLWNLLTSSGKSCFNHACYEYVSGRPPPLRTTTFIPSICRIYTYKFRIVSDFILTCRLVHLYMPYIRFLCVRPGLCLRLPSDSPHGGHPCPWLTIPTIKARSGLTPYSCCPCRANMNKGQGTFQFSALFLFYPSILMVSTNNKLALHPYLPTVNRNSL